MDVNCGKDVTLGEFLDYFEKKYRLEISMLSMGKASLYMCFDSKEKNAVKRSKKMSEIIKRVYKREFHKGEKYTYLEALVDDQDGGEPDIPYIRYQFRDFS